MTKDEAQRLLGEYATGSLTEAQRTELFAAALEDQELFEELAGEQAVKEVLDEPGARERLLMALEPAGHKAVWWPWAAATAALAIAVGFVIFQRTRPAYAPPQIIAQVTEASKGSISAPEPAPGLADERSPAAVPLRQKVAPLPAPVPELAKDERQAKAQAAADEVRAFAAGPAAAKGGARRAENVATVGFGFSYSVLVDGSLQIVPAEPGYLTVIVGDAVVFPSNPVPAFTPITIPMPAGATGVIIGFSRMPGITGSPAPRDALSGRENDQDPPNGRILIQLSLKTATQ